MLAGPNEQLSVADRRRCAEIFGVARDTIGCELLEFVRRFQDEDVAGSRCEVDLSIRDDWRGIVAAKSTTATASTTAAARFTTASSVLRRARRTFESRLKHFFT